MTNPFLNRLNTIYRGSRILIPFFSDLNTFYKKIVGTIFNESINNLPARFLPRVGHSNGSSEKLLWTTHISNNLTIWSVAFRMNDYQSLNTLGFVVGGASFKSIILKTSTTLKIGFRDDSTAYIPWDGSGNTIDVPTTEITNVQTDLIFYSDGTNIHFVLKGVYKGYITPSNTKLFFNRFILGYSGDTLGADGNFWDLRFWTSNIGQTEALKYHLDTMTVIPTNWFPDVYSGYDVAGLNHATSNLSVDYEKNGSTRPNDVGYSIWIKAANPDIQVQFDINGATISLTAGVNIPAGYSFERNVPAGGSNHNIYESLVNFDPDNNAIEKIISITTTNGWALVVDEYQYTTNGAVSYLTQTDILTIGKEYTITYEVIANPNNTNILFDDLNFTDVISPIFKTVGIHEYSRIAVTDDFYMRVSAGQASGLIIKNISIKETLAISILDRENLIRQTPTSRASEFYNSVYPFIYHIDELIDPNIYDTFFTTDYKNRVFGKVKLLGSVPILLKEFLNYATKKTGSLLTKVTNYCGITNIYP